MITQSFVRCAGLYRIEVIIRVIANCAYARHFTTYTFTIFARNGAMYISEASGTASCSCGALISLYVDHSSSQSNSKQNSAQNSQEMCYEGLQEKSYDRENTVLSASELKRRLGNVYDRYVR